VAYAFVQQNSNDAAGGAQTITVTLTPTAGHLLVFCISADQIDTTSIALSDNLGVHNTFTQIATDLVTGAGSDQRCAWYYAENCKGGATTFTATFSNAATRFRTIYVAEYSGIAISGAFLNGARAEQSNPGTATDGVSSGVANATSQPALVWGFSIDIFTGDTPTAGTGFTSRAGVWSTNTCLGRPEDKRVTATGNVAATFTTTVGTDSLGTGVGIFAEAAASLADDDDGPPLPPRVLPAVPPPTVTIDLGGDEVPGTAPASVVDDDDPPVMSRPPLPPRPLVVLDLGGDDVPGTVAPSIVDDESPAITVPRAIAWALARCGVDGDDLPGTTVLVTFEGDDRAPIWPIPVAWSRPPPPVEDSLPLTTIFPLSVDVTTGRFLRQVNGTPFLICGDSTWSLSVNLSAVDQATFLDDCVARGINCVMSNAIEHCFSVVKPPKDVDGNLPFTQRLNGASYTGSPNGTTDTNGTQGQFAADNYSSISTQAPDPTFFNSAYWNRVDALISACLVRNILIFIWPMYLGFHGGQEGWISEMEQWDAVIGAGGFTGQSFADPTKSKMWNYGAWLGARWAQYPNIVWVAGGDYGTNGQTLTAPQTAAVKSCIDGVKSQQPNSLWTAHWDRPCKSDDNLISGTTWALNFVYTDEPTAEASRAAYSSAAKPAYLGENNYEDGLFGGTLPFRKYLYWGFLGGIAGGFYGQEQLWRFDDGTPGTLWSTLLTKQGRLDAARQYAFWKAKPWYRLIPNGLGGIGTLITAGGGTASPQSTDYVAAAATPHGDLLLAYIPPAHAGSVTVDMTKLNAGVTASWFDPTNASTTAIGTFSNTGTRAFTPPATNSVGETDFLLVLETAGAILDEYEIQPVQLPLNAATWNYSRWNPWWPYDPEDVPIVPLSAIDDHEDVVGIRVPQAASWLPTARIPLDEDFTPLAMTIDDPVSAAGPSTTLQSWAVRTATPDDELPSITAIDDDTTLSTVTVSSPWVVQPVQVDEDFVASVLDEHASVTAQVPVAPWTARVVVIDDDVVIAQIDEDYAITPASQQPAWIVAHMAPDGDDLPITAEPTAVEDDQCMPLLLWPQLTLSRPPACDEEAPTVLTPEEDAPRPPQSSGFTPTAFFWPVAEDGQLQFLDDDASLPPSMAWITFTARPSVAQDEEAPFSVSAVGVVPLADDAVSSTGSLGPAPSVSGSGGITLSDDTVSASDGSQEVVMPQPVSAGSAGAVGPRRRPNAHVLVRIEDVDRGVRNWFDRVADVHVTTPQGDRRKVTVKFSSGERWVAAADRQGIRDRDGRLILPVIQVRRTGIDVTSSKSALGSNVPRLQIARLVSEKTTDLANLDASRPLSSRRLRDSAVYDIYTIPFPTTNVLRYQVTAQCQYQTHVNEIIEKIFSRLEFFNVPSFVISLTDDDRDRGIRSGRGSTEFQAEFRSPYEDRRPLSQHYVVGYIEGEIGDAGNLDEFTDQERILQLKFSFNVPTSLMLDPEGVRPAVQIERTAFRVELGDEETHFVDDPSELDRLFGSRK